MRIFTSFPAIVGTAKSTIPMNVTVKGKDYLVTGRAAGIPDDIDNVKSIADFCAAQATVSVSVKGAAVAVDPITGKAKNFGGRFEMDGRVAANVVADTDDYTAPPAVDADPAPSAEPPAPADRMNGQTNGRKKVRS